MIQELVIALAQILATLIAVAVIFHLLSTLLLLKTIAEPRSYHFCGRNGKRYSGDYHPDSGNELNREDYPEAFEKKPRACNNCGEIVYRLKEYKTATW